MYDNNDNTSVTDKATSTVITTARVYASHSYLYIINYESVLYLIPLQILLFNQQYIYNDNNNDNNIKIKYGDNDIYLITLHVHDAHLLHLFDHRSVLYLILLQMRLYNQLDALLMFIIGTIPVITDGTDVIA